MLTSLQLTNFRQFEELTIEPLARVNLIAGSNGTGKTSILEALYLLFGKPELLGELPSLFRQDQGAKANLHSYWNWLKSKKKGHFRISGNPIIDKRGVSYDQYAVRFQEQSPNNPFILTWEYKGLGTSIAFNIGKDGRSNLLHTGLQESQFWFGVEAFPTKFLTPFEDADRFNQVTVKRHGKERLTELLRIVEPHLNKLEYVKLDTPEPVIYAELDMDDLIPATQLGQGFSRLLRIFSGILASEAKIVLIDEIENGLHWTALEQVWRGIAELTRQQDVQIFATTHSLECIRAAHNVFVQLSNGNGYGDGFALHRLDRKKDGGVKVVTYDQETLQTSFEQNWEVR
jgi:hypothetical protein